MSSHNPDPSHPVLEVYLFGGVRLRAGDQEVSDRDSRSLKLWSVLCYLILNRNRPASQSILIEIFWPDEEQSDPAGALKMLIRRIRRLLAPLLGDVDPIIGRRGEYQWNPNVICQVDMDHFQALCAQAERDPSPASRGELLREAAAMYQSGLLPRFPSQQWLLPLSERCHSLYVKAVISYAAILEDAHEYEQMEALCLQASGMSRLDERLHSLVIRSLILQEKHADAARYYSDVTEILFNELGVRPSERLQELHNQISTENPPSGDLSEILSAMSEETVQGAFYCEFPFFKSIYQLEIRRMPRSGNCLYIALLTLSNSDGAPPSHTAIKPLMDGLLEDILASLRHGDVVSRCGVNQYIIMLPSANLEESTAVMDRVSATARLRLRTSILRLSYQLRGLGEP